VATVLARITFSLLSSRHEVGCRGLQPLSIT